MTLSGWGKGSSRVGRRAILAALVGAFPAMSLARGAGGLPPGREQTAPAAFLDGFFVRVVQERPSWS